MSHTFAAHPGGRHFDIGDVRGDQSDSPVILHVPYVERTNGSPTLATPGGFSRRNSPPVEHHPSVRYSPYPSPLSATTSRHVYPIHGLSSAEVSPTVSRPPVARVAVPIGETIKLPPIRPPAGRTSVDDGSFHLPPISSMDNLREAQCGEPLAVLRRLQCADEPPEPSAPSSWGRPTAEMLAQRRHSLADPMHRRSELSASSVGAGVRSAGGIPRTPLSAVAALPSQTPLPPLRTAQPEQQPRSAVDHSDTLASGARSQSARDDRLSQSMPPSPYLDAGRRDYRLCYAERHHPHPLEPIAQERVFSRQEQRPLSPPPSATSADSSPSDSVKPSWRPW
ncbi:hypothetical protein C8Q77DRAFT_1052531 [Trametes polyzona]|nr:hypothetical protein C8Q77DRAFT_1052531 [Trametes polyzona]